MTLKTFSNSFEYSSSNDKMQLVESFSSTLAEWFWEYSNSNFPLLLSKITLPEFFLRDCSLELKTHDIKMSLLHWTYLNAWIYQKQISLKEKSYFWGIFESPSFPFFFEDSSSSCSMTNFSSMPNIS